MIRQVVIAFVFGTLLEAGIYAQELEAFDLSDFVDPEARVLTEGEGPVPFLAVRFGAGLLDGYQRRDQVSIPTEVVVFARTTGNLYFGRNQVGLDVNYVEGLGREGTPAADARLQLARYFTMTDLATERKIAYRVQASWREALGGSKSFEEELSLSLDVLSAGSDTALVGGYVYTYQPHTGNQYLSYVSRGTVASSTTGIRLDMGLSFTREKVSGTTRWGARRVELSVVAPLPAFNSNLHFSYAPYYLPHTSAGNGPWGHELGMFLDADAFSKIIQRELKR